MQIHRGVAVLALASVLIAGCSLNQKERRAVMGGAIGGAGGAAVGDLTGLGLMNGALIGGAGGALLGAVTASDDRGKRVEHHHHHYRGKPKKRHRHRHHD